MSSPAFMPSQTRDCHGTQRAERASGRQRREAITTAATSSAPVRGSPIFESFAFDLAGRTAHRHGAGETDPDLVNEVSRQDEVAARIPRISAGSISVRAGARRLPRFLVQ